MNVLITGGLGFIGSNLAHSCVSEGDNVKIVTRSLEKMANIRGIEKKVKVVVKDVKDIGKAVEGADEIYHLAGSVDNYSILEGNPQEDVDLNCTNTLALLEACKTYNPNADILFASTFFVNGNLPEDQLPATPQSPCNPLGLYGATRLAGEHFCHIYNNVFGLNPIVARFTNVFGPREQTDNKKKAGFNYMIRLALEGKEIPLYDNGAYKRDFIYVDDVIDAIRLLTKKGDAEQVYYVGRGQSVKLRDMVEMAVEEAGSGCIYSVEPPEFHKKVGIRDFSCDIQPLKNLGWQPRVDLREGIRRTIEYLKNE